MHYSLRSLACLGFGLFLSSCATGGSGRGGSCRSDLARHPSSLNELVDSAALQSHLESIWEPVEGLVLGRIRIDSTGAMDGVTLRTESVSESQRERLVQAVSSAALDSPGRRDGTYLFLGDEGGPAVRWLARVQACVPELRNREMLSREIEEAAGQFGISERREVLLRAEVLVSGAVGDVEVQRSSGDSRIDMVAVRLFRTARYTPAMIEGIRVKVWVQFPVVFNPRSGGGGGTAPSPSGVSDAGQRKMSDDTSNAPARVG